MGSKLITAYSVTDVLMYNSQTLIELIDETDPVVYAGSVYVGNSIANKLPQEIKNQIHEKGYCNRP